jgi:hypothetical protein
MSRARSIAAKSINQPRNNSALSMLRPQFTIQTLLWLTLVVAFLGGIGFERERARREQESLRIAASLQYLMQYIDTNSEWSSE